MMDMSPELITVLMFGLLLAVILLGFPMAYALGGAAMVVSLLFFTHERTFAVFYGRVFGICSNYVLLAAPLFIFMGLMLERTGISEKLFSALHLWAGGLRGGLAMALNEIAAKSGTSIWLDADRIPVKPSVRAASEMLGLDPLEVTCEGRAVIVASPDTVDEVLAAVKKTRHGTDAAIIGEVKRERPGSVLLRTVVGGTRILRKPLGEPIPRVC
jgi:hydrogenase maturation factor HypE